MKKNIIIFLIFVLSLTLFGCESNQKNINNSKKITTSNYTDKVYTKEELIKIMNKIIYSQQPFFKNVVLIHKGIETENTSTNSSEKRFILFKIDKTTTNLTSEQITSLIVKKFKIPKSIIRIEIVTRKENGPVVPY